MLTEKSFFRPSIKSLQDQAVGALQLISEGIEKQINNANLIVNATDTKTQQIVVALNAIGLKIDETWTRTGTLEQYTDSIGTYVGKGNLA